MKVSQSAPNVCEMVQNDVPVYFCEVLEHLRASGASPGVEQGPGGWASEASPGGAKSGKGNKIRENFKSAQNDAKCTVNAQKRGFGAFSCKKCFLLNAWRTLRRVAPLPR